MAWHLNRRDLLVCGAAALSSVGLSAQAQTQPDLSFLVIGDWGRRGTLSQKAVAARMADERNSFVATVGDNFYSFGVKSTKDSHWRQSFLDVYDPQKLHTWYPALGNHDCDGKPEAQVAYRQVNDRWQMEDRYYSKRVTTSAGKTLDLIFLDTSPLADAGKYPQSDEAFLDQWRWFDRVAGSSDADWKLVFGHHPVWTSGNSGRDYPAFREALAPRLKQYGVHAYVAGHDHHLEHIVAEGMTYIVTGAGSKNDGLRSGKVAGHINGWKEPGFTSFQITGDTLTVSFIGLVKEPLGTATIPRLSHTRALAG